MLISTHLHHKVMHIHRPNLYFSFMFLMDISFFTVEVIHCVYVPVYSWKAVFPLSCANFFPVYRQPSFLIDSYEAVGSVFKQFLIIWHSSYSVFLFFVSWYINIFDFDEIAFLKKPQTVTDYFLCTMKITMSMSFPWRHSRFLNVINLFLFILFISNAEFIFVHAFGIFQSFEILRKLFLQFMAALKKLSEIHCVILVVKLNLLGAHHWTISDDLSRVYVISSAKIACKYFSGNQEIWKMDRILFFIFPLYSNQKV